MPWTINPLRPARGRPRARASLLRQERHRADQRLETEGLFTWSWNPVRSTLSRCSRPAKAVRATAGVSPARSGGSDRVCWISQYPSFPGIARSLRSTSGRSHCSAASFSSAEPTADLAATPREDVSHDLEHVGRVVDNQHKHVIETRARTEPHREEPYREATCETWSKVHTATMVPEGMENLITTGPAGSQFSAPPTSWRGTTGGSTSSSRGSFSCLR